MLRPTRTLAVIALALISASAGAQSKVAAVASTPPAKVAAADPIAEMSLALRTLITLQEKYWSDHGSYTTDGVALGIYPTAKDQPLFVQVIFAGSRGWTGMASYHGLKGKSCVVYVGVEAELPKIPMTSSDQTPAKGEGQPTCDGIPTQLSSKP
jgi:hypothetical protein